MLILIDVVRYWTSGVLGTDSTLLDGRSTPDDRGPNNLGARLEVKVVTMESVNTRASNGSAGATRWSELPGQGPQ